MRPRLLFLSQCLPYPPHSGVTNRTYHILKGLAESFEITLLPFSRKNHQENPDAVRSAVSGIERLGVRVRGPFSIASERSRTAKLAVHVLSLISGKPYTYYEYGDRHFAAALREELRDHSPALVHVDSLDLHRWILMLRGFPVACTHHSIESDLLRLLAKQEPNPLFQAYLRRQASLIESVEQKLCPGFVLNVMMSDLDGTRLQRIAPHSRTVIAPNGVDVDKMRPPSDQAVTKGRVAFLGASFVRANRDATEYFLSDVWPLIRQARPDATFQVVGKVDPAHKTMFEASPGVSCIGFVENLGAVLAAAECIVVPLRIGGGTRLKILDAWAVGRPVVSTSIGCEGLAAVDQANILVADTPGAFAESVIRVLGDVGTGHSIGAGGRTTVEAQYSWDAIGSSLADRYHSAIEVAHATRGSAWLSRRDMRRAHHAL